MNTLSKMLRKQAGVSLTGLIVILAAIGMVSVVVIEVAPTYTEYLAAKRAIASAKASGNTEKEIRAAFDRQADVGYIRSLAGSDLDVINRNGTFEVGFAYRKVIHLVGIVSLQMDYEDNTAGGGQAKAARD